MLSLGYFIFIYLGKPEILIWKNSIVLAIPFGTGFGGRDFRFL